MARQPEKQVVELTDADIISEVRRGGRDAFRALVQRYQGRAYSIAFQVLRNREDAEDVVQESFVKAYLSLDQYKGDSSFYTWLYRIVFNMSIDLKRKHARTSDQAVSLDADTKRQIESKVESGISQRGENPDEALLRKEQGRQIQEVLGSISDEHRAVVILREIDGLPYEQIAETLGISKGTVMSRLHYARKRLQQYLKDLWKENGAPDEHEAPGTGVVGSSKVSLS